MIQRNLPPVQCFASRGCPCPVASPKESAKLGHGQTPRPFTKTHTLSARACVALRSLCAPLSLPLARFFLRVSARGTSPAAVVCLAWCAWLLEGQHHDERPGHEEQPDQEGEQPHEERERPTDASNRGEKREPDHHTRRPGPGSCQPSSHHATHTTRRTQRERAQHRGRAREREREREGGTTRGSPGKAVFGSDPFSTNV